MMHMKKLFVLLSLLVLGPYTLLAFEEGDYSRLTVKNHPRMFLTDTDIKNIRSAAAYESIPYLSLLHDQMIRQAQKHGLSEKPLVYAPKVKNEPLLSTIRSGVIRIISASYAYRMTRDKAYLNHAVSDINTICDNLESGTWQSDHFLDMAEMSLAFGIAYDWLYKQLKPEIKDKMVRCIRRFVYEKAHGHWFYTADHNWNNVCNCGIITAALATYETDPELSRSMIEKSVKSNRRALTGIYAPDGASQEGPTYWSYATSFQAMLLMTLEDNLGTDFGLGSYPGFEKTGYYRLFMESNRKYFNYSDSGLSAKAAPALWYCAYKFENPSLIYSQLACFQKNEYVDSRDLFLAVTSAYRMGKVKAAPSTERIYQAHGTVPVAVCRTGWDKDALYLGIKGGVMNANHAHMDIGTFVFDAYGTRWACDYPIKAYQKQRNVLAEAGISTGELFNYAQDSYRWSLFCYGNERHNTLIVNGKRLDVAGKGELLGTFDSNGRMGAELDLSTCYFDVEKVLRKAEIVSDQYLEITDVLKTGATPACVRFNWVTQAEPQQVADGFILQSGKRKMKLSCSQENARWRQWSNNPADYDTPTAKFEKTPDGYWIIGYEYDADPETEYKVVTTLKEIK